MSVTVANTAANLSGDTLMTAENAETLTGQKTFSNTILFSPDNTYDIGATGANRPRDVFIADDLTVGDATTIGGTLGVTGAATLSSTLAVTGVITGRDFTTLTSASTGTQNNWVPGTGIVAGSNVLYWTGASDAAITGIAGGSQGTVLIIYNNAGGPIITFAWDSGSSSVGNKFANYVTSAPTPIAHRGSVIYIHDGTHWRMVGHEQGTWITPTFAAGNYTGSGSMTWTLASGDVSVQKYHLAGKHLKVAFTLSTTTVGGTPAASLQIGNGTFGGFSLPGGEVSPVIAIDNAAQVSTAFARGEGSNIVIVKNTNANAWTAGTDNVYVWGTWHGEVT